jgi:rfaE bifunctional protein kinase chain/domain
VTTPTRSDPRLPVERVAAYAERLASARVAVLGDVMLDRYFWGEAERISPEAPVPIVHVKRRSARLGGAANVAANLRALDVAVHLLGITGDDREGAELRELVAAHGIDASGLVDVSGRETTEKVRIIARNQQVLRADFETESPPPADATGRLFAAAGALAKTCDALVVSDYGKGVVAQAPLGALVAAWRAAGKPVLVDPFVPHFPWYVGASVVTPNTKQVFRAAGLRFGDGEDPAARAFAVMRELSLDALLVTRGEDGMSLFHGEGGEVHIPTVAKEVYDVTGAGDTVIGVLAAALASGVDLTEAVIMANAAAGEVVREVGTASVTRDVLVSAFK